MAQITISVEGDNNAQRLFRQVTRDIDDLGREQTRFNENTISGQLRVQAAYAATSFVIHGLARAFESLVRNTIEVSANFEATAARLTALGENGDRVAETLVRIARAEDGLTFDNLSRTVSQLVSSGLALQEATNLTVGYARQLAITNTSIEDQARFFQQLQQAYAGNVAEGNDLRTLFEVMPQLSRIISQALGVQINSWKDIRQAIEDSGLSLREILVIGGEVAGQAIVDPDQFRIQQERLTESIEALQRVIGERLLPVLTSATRGATSFFDAIGGDLGNFTRFSAGTAVAATALATLTSVIGTTIVGFINFRRTVGLSVLSINLFGAVLRRNAALALHSFLSALIPVIQSIAALQIALAAAIPIITATTVVIGAIAVAMRNAREEATSFQETIGNIGEGIRFDDALGRVRTFSDFTTRELREGLNNLITERERIQNELAEISVLGVPEENVYGRFNRAIDEQRTALQSQQNVTESLIRRFQGLIEARNQDAEATETQTQASVTLRAEITEFGFVINRLRQQLRDADSAVDISPLQRRLRAELRERFSAQVDAAVAIEDEGRRNDQLIRINEQYYDDLAAVDRLGFQRRQSLAEEDRDRRTEIANSIRDIEVRAFEEAAQQGERYAQVLRSFESARSRIAFAELVASLQAQGESFENAIAQAQRLFVSLEQIQQLRIDRALAGREAEVAGFERAAELGESYVSILQNLESVQQRRAFVEFVERLQDQGLAFREAVAEAERLIETLERFPDVAGSLERSLLNEQEAFSDINPGDESPLERIRRESREEGAAFIRRLFQRQLSEEESDLRESLNRQFRQYQRFYTRVSDVAIDALFGRIESFREVALRLFEEIIRGVIRVEITEAITAARTLAIDTALTEARIANQERLRAAIQNTQAANFASAGGGVGGLNIGGLPGLGGGLTGGVGALGVSSLLFPQLFSNLGEGIGSIFSRAARAVTRPDALASQAESEVRNFNLIFDDGTIRKVTGRATTNRGRRR